MPAFFSPSGLYIVCRENIGAEGYVVRVLNFATWKHQSVTFDTAEAARRYASLWSL